MLTQYFNTNQYQQINTQNIHFKAGVINILAQADQHGHVLTMPYVEKTIKSHFHEMFYKSEHKSTLNIFAIAGDFFMNPKKRGFLTHPKLSNGDFESKYLKFFINILKNMFKQKNFQTVFTPGNHDFDGGDCWLMPILSKLPMISLMTNVNLAKSHLFREYQKKSNNFVKSKIFTIPDDKNEKLKHKVLFLGITIPAMKFYAPGLLKGIEFCGDKSKKDSKIDKKDLTSTILSIKNIVKKFKNYNPNGAVILLSHTGNRLSEIIRKEIPDINIIFNGHDHVNYTSLNAAKVCTKDKSKEYRPQAIVSLGCDNKILQSVTLQFNDNGKLDNKIIVQTYDTNINPEENTDDSLLSEMIKKDFQKDIIPLVKNIDSKGELKALEYSRDITWHNSYLLNYLTSELCNFIKNNFNGKYTDITSIALQTSGIRGGIKEGATNIDLMKVFDGVNEDLSELYIGSVSGRDLIGMIFENVKENLGMEKRERNTLLYWSDIQINRSMINDIINNKIDCSARNAIKIRGKNGKFNKSVDLNKKYRIIVPNKYIIKTDIEYPAKIKKDFLPLGITPDTTFRMALTQKKYSNFVNDQTKEIRVINTTNEI